MLAWGVVVVVVVGGDQDEPVMTCLCPRLSEVEKNREGLGEEGLEVKVPASVSKLGSC